MPVTTPYLDGLLEKVLGVRMPNWQDALDQKLDELGSKQIATRQTANDLDADLAR